MRARDKTTAIDAVLAQVALELGAGPAEAALPLVAERCYDAGYEAAAAQARMELRLARQTTELHLNEVAKLRARFGLL